MGVKGVGEEVGREMAGPCGASLWRPGRGSCWILRAVGGLDPFQARAGALSL